MAKRVALMHGIPNVGYGLDADSYVTNEQDILLLLLLPLLLLLLRQCIAHALVPFEAQHDQGAGVA
jgi:hypothetical protein